MRVGVVKEIKPQERRVALTPAGARQLVADGHRVLVQRDAGAGAGHDDAAYELAGAELLDTAEETWAGSDLLLKVKEPIKEEYDLLRPDLTLFTYLHLAADRPLTEALLDAGTTAFAYESVETDDGRLPLLAPMSEVAGRLAPFAAAQALLSTEGGPGKLLSGVTGVEAAKVTVIGGGIVGYNAAKVAAGAGARVTLLDTSVDRLRDLESRFAGGVELRTAVGDATREACAGADVIIGAVLVPNARAPHVLDAAAIAELEPGTVLVDVAIDQGGAFATSRPTTHAEPTYSVGGVIHYAVANMPGAVPVTSTAALTNVTLPYVRTLAGAGAAAAAAGDPALRRGLVVDGSRLHNAAVATAHDLPYHPSDKEAA